MKDVEEEKINRVCVYSFSRYARSTTHLLRALEKFKKYNVAFVSITEAIDTNSPLGVAIFSIVGAISQLERDILVERVKNGLAAAKKRGVQLGRKKTRPSGLIRTLRKSGMTYVEIARIAKCSTGAVAKEITEMKKEIAEGKEQKMEAEVPNTDVSQEPSSSPHNTIEPEIPLEIVRF